MSVFTNLATNPSMEDTSGTVEVRRNYCRNPFATEVTSGSANGFGQYVPGTGEAGSVTFITGAADGPTLSSGVRIPSYARRTTTVAKTGASTGWQSTGGAYRTGQPGVTGDTRRAGVWFRYTSPDRSPLPGRMRNGVYSTAGVLVNSADSPAISLLSGVWTFVEMAVTAIGEFESVGWWFYQVGLEATIAGSTLDTTGCVVGDGEVFAGSLSPDVDLTASWTGAANASASVLTGKKVTGITGGIQSTQWAAEGTKSLRVDTGTATVPVTGPVTITARAAGQTATLGGVSVTSTSAGEALVLTGAGTLTLSVGWWDKLGDGITQWFSGNSGTNTDWIHAWTGPANASTSTRTPTPGLRVEGFTDAPCPRVGITLDGLATTGPSRVTLWRSTAGGQRRKVRGWDKRQVYGSDYAIDYETPLGRPVRYDLVVDTGPTVPLRVSDTVTLNTDTGYIQDPLQPLGAVPMSGTRKATGPVLRSAAFQSMEYTVGSTQVQVMGRRDPVALTGQRMAASGLAFPVFTHAAEQATALRNLLTETSLVLVRPLPAWGPLPDLVYTVPSVTEELVDVSWGGSMTRWHLAGDSVAPPSIDVLVALWTYDQVAALWSTYASAQAAATATAARYLDVQRDPTMGV